MSTTSKLRLLLILACADLSGVAATPIGVRVTDTIVPTSTDDTYPTHEATYGKGGLRTVAETDDLRAIPLDRREEGMEVYCMANRITYLLAPDKTNWYPRGAVSVGAFGARADGETDDSEAFNSAVRSGSPVIYVPNASYAIRSGITITNSVRLVGEHKDRTILKYFGTNFAVTIGGGTNFLTRGVELENLFLIGWMDPPYDGSYAPTNAAGLVKIHGATRGRLNNIRTSNARGGDGILFLDRAWCWDVWQYQAFDLRYGINFQCAAGVGDLVNSITIDGGEISGCDWGMLSGRTNASLGFAERGIATLSVRNVATEANRYGGIWLNQTEVANIATYWEANGGTHIRLGNPFDTNWWSCSAINIVGNRFATTTNRSGTDAPIEIWSANNCRIDGNDFQDIRATAPKIQYSVAFLSTNHFGVMVGPNNLWRTPGGNANPIVLWTDGLKSSVTQYKNDPFGLSVRTENSNSEFGDDSGSWPSTDRLKESRRYLSVNSTNGPVGLFASMFGVTGQPRGWIRTDGSAVFVGGGIEAAGGGKIPIVVEMNGVRYMTLNDVQTVNPNRMVIGETNGFDKLTVYGNVLAGDPAAYGGYSSVDKRVAIVSTNASDRLGLFAIGLDGINNRRFKLSLDQSVPEVVLESSYSSGGDIPIKIRGSSGLLATFDSVGLTLPSDRKLTIGDTKIVRGTAGGTNALLIIWPSGTTNVLALQP